MQNYFDILDVDTDASDKEIKDSYRRLAMKYHPDRSNVQSDDAFKLLNEAYAVLSDPHTRSLHLYNLLMDIDESEFIKTLKEKSKRKSKSISISLDQAYTGTIIRLDGGKTLTIVPGAATGDRIKIDSHTYTIKVQHHPIFKRADSDLLVDVNISAAEAMVGIPIELEHLDGSMLQYNIPPGIQGGQVIKLDGCGMPNGKINGDLLVRVNVEIPKTLSRDQIEFLYQIFDIRSKVTL